MLAHSFPRELLPPSFSFSTVSPNGKNQVGHAYSDEALNQKHHIIGQANAELTGPDAGHRYYLGTDVLTDAASASALFEALRTSKTAQVSIPPGFDTPAVVSIVRGGQGVFCFALDDFALAFGQVDYNGQGDPGIAAGTANAIAMAKAALVDLRRVRGR
jgi:hypothetical protein